MKRGAVIAAFVVLAGVFILLAAHSGLNPILPIEVVDAHGASIAGAVVTMDGIRGTDGGHYGWSKERPVKTDQNGRADMRYPRFITERVRSIEVSFGVEHPDFCAVRPFLQVASPATSKTPILQRLEYLWLDLKRQGKVQKVVLKPGAVLEVSGTMDGTPIPAAELRAQVTSKDGVFPSGSFREMDGKIFSRRLPAGEFMVRAIYLAKEGGPKFSDPVTALAVSGGTNSVKFKLKPGHQVRGKLVKVPAPVANGWVNARIINNRSPGSDEYLVWADFAKVNPDGTFVIEDLPSGRLEMVAICDGFLSQNPSDGGGFVMPVTWELNGDLDVSLVMRESATAEIHLTDPEGHPLANVEVAFWPNIQWANSWSTIFAEDFYRSLDVLKRGALPWSQEAKRSFLAKTDQNGKAVIANLPPWSLAFSIVNDAFEVPLEANAHESTITLMGGKTNRAVLKLQKKGKQFRE